MRKLLVKLVAAETALLGWLTYWLFLVYANNPGVSEGLTTELSRFPQISYTTIDISIIVLITIFSIVLAIKFDRGLRPGMKLERALQMLENLMKRNLFLESQLAEFRGDKLAGSSTGTLTQSPLKTSGAAPSTDMSSSTWERAFRTPIEAGPPAAKMSVASQTQVNQPLAFGSQLRDARGLTTEPNVPAPRDEKVAPKPVPVSNWEDSPARTLETRGIITPSPPPPVRKPTPTLSFPTSGSQATTRLPYIPAPAPKPSLPPSVITGPLTKPSPVQAPLKPGVPAQARPIAKLSQSTQLVQPPVSKPTSSLQPLTTLTPLTSLPPPTKPSADSVHTTPSKTISSPVLPTTKERQEEVVDEAEEAEDLQDARTKRVDPRKIKASFFDEDSD